MAGGVTNQLIDDIYTSALNAGASGGKISGAGGGGFMIFYCPGVTRYSVVEALSKFGGQTAGLDHELKDKDIIEFQTK